MFLRRILTSGAGSALVEKFKESTGIVGLEVVPNAREVLISLYTKTLQEIKGVPENEVYRKAVECFTSHRLKVCQEEEEDWEQIEKRIGCGQVEELIEEAQDELKLIDKMIARMKTSPLENDLKQMETQPGPINVMLLGTNNMRKRSLPTSIGSFIY